MDNQFLAGLWGLARVAITIGAVSLLFLLVRWLARFQRLRVTARVVGSATRGRDLCVVEGQRVTAKSYSGQRFDRWMAIDSVFEDCDFTDVSATDFCFGGGPTPSVYRRCRFDGANLGLVVPGVARFERCSFERMILRDANFPDAEFVDCSFSGRLSNLVFWGSRRRPGAPDAKVVPLEFQNNDFSRSIFRGVSFKGGIELKSQRLPQGDDYLTLPTGEGGWRIVLEMARELEHAEAEHLRSLEAVLRNEHALGQEAIFFSVSDLASTPGEAALLRKLAARLEDHGSGVLVVEPTRQNH